MKTGEIFKKLILLMEREIKNFSIEKFFVAANKRELGGGFHSFTV